MFPDLSVLWVIFFVLVLTILLDRLLLRPLQRVMHQREEATRSARALAERSAQEAREAAAEFERKTTAARADVYRQMDDMRRTALAERTEILAQTRAQAERESPPPLRNCKLTQRKHDGAWRLTPKRSVPKRPNASSAARAS